MSDAPVFDAKVELFPASTLRLVQGPLPQLRPHERAAMDACWERAVQDKPTLFDGPAVACLGLSREGDDLVLTWAPVSYRYRALRRVENCSWTAASVFVTVLQPTDDHGLLVGRSSVSTVAPGRWGLPGGSAEPPAQVPLTVEHLRRHAAQELAEEAGVTVAPRDMALWGVTRGKHGNVGVHFTAPPAPLPLLLERHRALCASECARGVDPELDRVAVVRAEADVNVLGFHVDYLPSVVRRYTGR